MRLFVKEIIVDTAFDKCNMNRAETSIPNKSAAFALHHVTRQHHYCQLLDKLTQAFTWIISHDATSAIHVLSIGLVTTGFFLNRSVRGILIGWPGSWPPASHCTSYCVSKTLASTPAPHENLCSDDCSMPSITATKHHTACQRH